MKLILAFLSLCVISSMANASEWCPKHQGNFPSAVVDLGSYQLFYFTPGDIYNEDGQAATVYLVKDKNIVNVTAAEGYSEWFTTTEYVGADNGFVCDSITLEFWSAWFLDENKERKTFDQGEVRAPGYRNHELVCSE